MIKRFLRRFKKKEVQMSPIEVFRNRGVKIGQDVDIINSQIDYLNTHKPQVSEN